MLSAFASSIRQFVFGRPENSNTVSRKRRRDENDEVDGENGEDAPLHSTPKKLKTRDINQLQIQGMPSSVKARMTNMIQAQKQRKIVSNSTPLSYTSNVSLTKENSGEIQGLARPPIHHLVDITCQATNGPSDLLNFEVERDVTDGISKTKLTNGQTDAQAHSNGQSSFSSTLITGRNSQSGVRSKWQTPSFSRTKKNFPVKLHNSRSEQFLPMFDKTFSLSRNSSFNDNGRRAYSVHHKRQLLERETYKQLLHQFSSTNIGQAWPQRSSTPQTSFTQEWSARTPKPSQAREVPVITLDSSVSEKSTINKSTLQQSESFSTPRPLPSKVPSIKDSPYIVADWAKGFREKFSQIAHAREKEIASEKQRYSNLEEQRYEKEREKQKTLERRLLESRRERAVIEEDVYEEETVEEEEEDVEEQFPELTIEMEEEIESALEPHPPDEVLTECFKIQIKRRDMITLAGLNWLNDEIINFYMNMLMDRGEQDNYGKAYAFNTFFYPKLLSSGYSSIRRWTRRTNIFDKDYLIIPIHLGMHWCLAIVDFKKKAVNYYDSMGGKNPQCLNTIRQYLCDESLDKRKTEFDLTNWTLNEMKGIPEQLNGSDCGMFTCKYAEYVTRDVPITFTQEHMPYFRRRMVYEILSNKLL